MTISDPWSNNALELDGSRVIDRRIYVDPSILATEQERIFARTWQWVAHASELPDAGDYITASVAGRSVIVVRDKHDQYQAFFNTCTHRGACLSERARGNCGGKFVCMYHGWSFDTRGKSVGVAWAEAYGEDFDRSRYDIPSVRVETFAGNIFVTLDRTLSRLETFLGEAAEHLQRYTGNHEVLGRVRWMLDGNWKLWHENFRDNYHPQFTHRQVAAQYRGRTATGKNLELEPAHSLLWFPRQGDTRKVQEMLNEIGDYGIDIKQGTQRHAPKEDVPGGLRNEILAVFPNLDFQWLRNGAMCLLLQVVRPLAVDRAIVEGVAFGEVGEAEAIRDWRLKGDLASQTSAGKISGDDVEAARRCTVGFSAFQEIPWSNMDRGQQAGTVGGKTDEYSMRRFYSAYKHYMGESLAL